MDKKIKPLRVVKEDYVCECCYLWLGSADDSSCRYYWGHGEVEHPRGLCGGLAGGWAVAGGHRWVIRASHTCVGCGGEVALHGALFKVNQLGR